MKGEIVSVEVVNNQEPIDEHCKDMWNQNRELVAVCYIEYGDLYRFFWRCLD